VTGQKPAGRPRGGRDRGEGRKRHLLDVVATKRVNHSRNTWDLPATGVIKVEHALDGPGLESIDEGPRLGIKRSVPRPSAGSSLDLVK
jgi:hypothetical protein